MLKAEKEYIHYTDSYKQYGENILLKIAHSYRVRDLCTDIARHAGLCSEEIEMATVCGLFHDIGRFEQWKRYQTFDDAKSADHGDLGVEIIRREKFFRTFPADDVEAIVRTVKYHNKYRLPDTLDERSRLFASVVRDADKIDILHLISKGELKKKSHNSVMSDFIYQSLLDCRGIMSRDFETKADRIAIYLAFPFNFCYKRSFEIVQENDYINKIIDLQIIEGENAGLKEQLETMRTHLEKYIRGESHA